ncbi:MAG: thiamine-phosphate kinase [Candidatus Bipolaricaulaceae bacterium]
MNEWALLERVKERVPGAGDDCAVLPMQGTYLLLTTDMLHQASDFPPGTTPYTIGWRSVAVSLSDIAAMGGVPRAVLVAASAPDWTEVFDGVLAGAQAVCAQAGGELVGGDMDSSGELFVTTTVMGTADRPIMRAGAQPGDLLCVTGRLGRTAAALRALAQGRVREGNALLRFPPRTRFGQRLAGIATSMIDISDGLAHSVHLLARAGGVGLEVDLARIPVMPRLSELAGADEAWSAALYYGEDYELLFTAPPDRFRPGLGRVVGRVADQGVWLVSGDRRDELPDRGWSHGR